MVTNSISHHLRHGSLNHTLCPVEACCFFKTKKKGNHHLQGNVPVYNVRISVRHPVIRFDECQQRTDFVHPQYGPILDSGAVPPQRSGTPKNASIFFFDNQAVADTHLSAHTLPAALICDDPPDVVLPSDDCRVSSHPFRLRMCSARSKRRLWPKIPPPETRVMGTLPIDALSRTGGEV